MLIIGNDDINNISKVTAPLIYIAYTISLISIFTESRWSITLQVYSLFNSLEIKSGANTHIIINNDATATL